MSGPDTASGCERAMSCVLMRLGQAYCESVKALAHSDPESIGRRPAQPDGEDAVGAAAAERADLLVAYRLPRSALSILEHRGGAELRTAEPAPHGDVAAREPGDEQRRGQRGAQRLRPPVGVAEAAVPVHALQARPQRAA